jgi:hypothetical protein
MNICLHEFEVKGILDGMITELWRPVKIQPLYDGCKLERLLDSTAKKDTKNIGKLRWEDTDKYFDCPFGPIGTRIVGKEIWLSAGYDNYGQDKLKQYLFYKADGWAKGKMKDWGMAHSKIPPNLIWRLSTSMPSWASRITLINAGVKCKQVNKITYAEMKAAGFEAVEQFDGCFAEVWNHYNAPKYPFESAYGWRLKFKAIVQ